MDYFSMKRKELQALCKEHNIPANSANLVLANKLSQLLNEKEKPVTRKRACLKSSVETTNDDEPAVSTREVKKVRFSPNNDVLEYQTRSGKKHVATPINTKTRRKSVAAKVDKLVVDSDSTIEVNDESVQIPAKRSTRAQGRVGDVKETNVVKEPEGNIGKVTRSKANILAKGDVVQSEERKQIKKPVKHVKKGSEPVEEAAVGRVRATRSKVQAVTDDSISLDVNPQVKKTRGGQVAKDVPPLSVTDESISLDVNPQVKKTRGGQVAKDVPPLSVTDESISLDVNPQVKKTRGGQVAKDVQNGENSELMEIPARVTRSRQNPKEEVSNVVSNPKAEKKRTRREMNATDQSSNLSNVAPEDNQELPKRKSLRTRVENMDEAQGDKGDLVNGGRATRAKAQLAVKSGGDVKSRAAKKVVVPKELKVVTTPEEPIKKAGSKNVSRRESVMPSNNSKETVNRRTRNTRSESVMPDAQENASGEPEMAGSPAVEKKLAKGISVDVTKSGKTASELKTLVNAPGSPKSRKRRGAPVTEDQGIGTDYRTVDESARRSTRSSGESEGTSAANKQAASVKTPTSRIGKLSAVEGELSEGNQRGTRQALRSGAATRGDSSNKRAKLSPPKQSDAENSAVKSSRKGTPVSKLLNFEPDEIAVETELTPVIDGSRSKITRSAIRSNKTAGSSKKPSQTSIKKQPTQISTRKAAKARPDPAVNTAPGRVTRSGVKDAGNASSHYAEKVEKKKSSRSAHRVQPLDDAQIFAPEVAEASPNLGVEVHKEAMGGISGNTGDLSRSEMRLPMKVVEENMVSVSETAIVVESISTVSGEKSYGAEPHSISNESDAEARDVGEGMEVADASIQLTPNVAKPETGVTPCLTENLLSETQQKPLDLPCSGDEPLLVPTLSETPLQPLSELKVQIAVNPEKLDANEMDSAETGFVSMGQQTDVMVEEQVVSIETTVVMEDNAGVSLGDAENECDIGSHNIPSSAVYHDSFVQPDVISTKEVESPVEPSNIENVSEQGAEDESASAPASLTTKLVSEDIDDTLDQSTDGDKLQGLFSAKNDAAYDSLTDPPVLPTKDNLTSDDVADVSVDARNEPAKELEYDVKSPDVMSTKEVEAPVEPSNIQNGSEQGAEDESTSASASLTTKLISEDNHDTLDQATDDDKLQGLLSAKTDAAYGSSTDPSVLPTEDNTTSDDVADVSVDARNEPAKELESDVVQSPDVMSTEEVETPVEPSNIENGSEPGAEDDSASALASLTAKLVTEDNDDTLDQATDDDKLQGLSSAEIDAAHGSLTEPSVLPAEDNIISDDVADVSVDAGNEPAEELESDVVQSRDVMSTEDVEMPVEPSNIENGSEQVAADESVSAPKLVTEDNDDTLDQATDDDKLQGISSAEIDAAHGSLTEPSVMPAEDNITSDDVADVLVDAGKSLTTKLVTEDNDDTLDQATDDDKLQGVSSAEIDAAHGSSTEPSVMPAEDNITSDDVADVLVDAGNEPAEELESDVVQSPDVMSTKEVETTVEPSNIENGSEDERASAPTTLTAELVSKDGDDTLDQATAEDTLQGPCSAENYNKDGMDAAHGSLVEPNVLPAEEDITSDVADVSVDAGNEPAKELESDVMQSTGTDVHQSPIFGRSDNEVDSPISGEPDGESDGPVFGKFDSEDANVNTEKECETDKGPNSEHLLQDPVLSGGDGDDGGVSTNNEHESNSKLDNNNNDVSDTRGKNDDFNMTQQPEFTSEPSSFNDITAPYSANDVFGTPLGKDDALVDTGNEPTKELESDAIQSTISDVPILGKSGDENDISIFGASVSPKFDGEDAIDNELSGGEDDDVNTNNGCESDPTLVTCNDDDFNMTKQPEPVSEPSSSNDINETPFSGSYIQEEALKPLTGNDLIPTPVIGEDDVKDDTISVPIELETGLEPSNDNESLKVHVSGNVVQSEYFVDAQSDEQEGESERYKSASNGSPGTDEQYVEEDDLEPENKEDMSATTEILISSSRQESVPESNIARGKITCYTAGVSNPVGPSDLSMSTEAPPTPATSGDEVASVTVDVLKESLSDINKDVVANIFGDIYGLGSTEVTDITNDYGNQQLTIVTSEIMEGVPKESESVYPSMSGEQIPEETNTTKEINNASTSDHCMDGGSEFGVDDFDTQLVGDIEAYEYPSREGSPSFVFPQEFSASPTSSRENDRNEQGKTQEMDACQEGLADYSFRRLISANESYVLVESQKDNQVSDIDTAGASFFEEGSPSSAAGLVGSVKNFDKAFGHMTGGKSTQADVIIENPNPNLNEENFNWNDSSLKSFFSTPAVATTSHAKGTQENQVEYSNEYHYSVKSLFTTPATATVGHLQGGQDYAISSGFPDNRCNRGETNMEDSTNKLFEDELDGSSDWSGKSHFDFDSHQFDFSAGAAGTDHHETSGLKEDSIDSGSYEEEKETQLKGPKPGDNNSF